MANRIEQARAAVDACIREAYLRAVAAGELPEGAEIRGGVEQPKDTANGDFAANHAMASAKTMHMAPRKIAEALIAHMELGGSWFSGVEAAGPGFLNFRLSDKWYQDVLSAVESSGADYGRVDDGHGEKVMVEFVSANPTGPMTIGNARGGVLGDALASVLEREGPTCRFASTKMMASGCAARTASMSEENLAVMSSRSLPSSLMPSMM